MNYKFNIGQVVVQSDDYARMVLACITNRKIINNEPFYQTDQVSDFTPEGALTSYQDYKRYKLSQA